MSANTVNCPNCGAPLAAAGCGLQLECRFCGSRRALPTGRLDDCVVPLGHPTDHNCPVCVRALVEAVVGEREAEYCEGCRGILVGTDEFRDIVQQRRAGYAGPDARPTPINSRALERNVSCPGCHAAMDVHPFYGPGNTVIDSCRGCGLVWLDSGELTAIERAPGRR